MMQKLSVALVLLLAAAACYPATTRPRMVPLPESALLEVALIVPDATRDLALRLDQDSIPVRRTEPADGWLETEWFDAATLKTTSARIVGPDVVKVRAWVDPSKPDHSVITIETVYRPYVDPSRNGRLLERQVADTHAVAKRVAAILKKLRAEFGEPDTTTPSGTGRP